MFDGKNYGRIGDVWVSDRFVGGYDNEVNDFYIEDKYVGHRYFRNDSNYHIALVSLLNDRQGYINFILDVLEDRINGKYNDEYYRSLYRELKDEICNYREIWE